MIANEVTYHNRSNEVEVSNYMSWPSTMSTTHTCKQAVPG